MVGPPTRETTRDLAAMRGETVADRRSHDRLGKYLPGCARERCRPRRSAVASGGRDDGNGCVVNRVDVGVSDELEDDHAPRGPRPRTRQM